MVLRAKAAFAKMDAEEHKTDMEEFVIVIIPFLGTAVGAAMVFFLKAKMNTRLEHVMLGFAAGVMIAASFWSLLQPAIQRAEAQPGLPAWFVATSGFLFGAVFMWGSDKIVSLTRRNVDRGGGGEPDRLNRIILLVISITLHNIPEGLR